MIPSPAHRALWLAVLCLAAPGCGRPCTNRVVESDPSPGNKLRAVVFERSCQPAGPRQLHVSIIPFRSAEPAGDGNALVVEPTASAAEPRLRLEWIDRNRLRVSYSAGVRVVKSVRAAAAVQIEYVPIVEDGSTTSIGEP